MAEWVRITDVAPRDGLQNEPRPIPTADKVRLVELLGASGVDEIEVSSFVSPRWVPQLGDAAEVFAALAERKPPRCLYSALTPNEQGLAAACAVNEAASRHAAAAQPLIDKVAVFTAASETFARRNTNASIAETLKRFEPVVAGAQRAGLLVRGYVSCVVRCPFEGDIAPEQVADVAARLCDLGIDELDLGETIGAGAPATIEAMLAAVQARIGSQPALTLHLHDTFGRAADCVRAALRCGIRSFDGSAGGLGGCPYASTPGRRAPGNIATETLLATLTAEGFTTHLDPGRLAGAAEFARRLVSPAAQ